MRLSASRPGRYTSECRGRSYFTTDSQSVSHMSWYRVPLWDLQVKVILQLTVSQSLYQGTQPILGLVTRYYLLFEGCFLKFALLSFWDALSDERPGPSFAFLSLVICHYLYQIFMLHVLQFSNLYTINIKLQKVPSEYSRLCCTSFY
jgi:hypothetical protein